ncbi:MAG: hypothetical protein IJC29_02690, partial [Clostridia bacterium]|nr:hypothetical protein [Clostridia bacterium]
MKHTNVKKSSLVALMLVLTLVVGCLGALAMGAVSAATVNKEAPEITPKGEYDVWDGTTVSDTLAQDENGDYLIQSAADFVGFYQNLAAAATAADTYRLTRDIDISAKNIVSGTGVDFLGTLDGDGYVITGLGMRMAGYSGGCSLFRTLTGTVRNISFKNTKGEALNDAATLINSANGATLENINLHYTSLKGYAVALCQNATDCT